MLLALSRALAARPQNEPWDFPPAPAERGTPLTLGSQSLIVLLSLRVFSLLKVSDELHVFVSLSLRPSRSLPDHRFTLSAGNRYQTTVITFNSPSRLLSQAN